MKRVYPAMALAGVATTMLGPLLPGFAERGGWSDARSGVLFSAQFLASVIVSAEAGPMAMRVGYSILIRAGLVAIAAGCASAAMASPAMLPLCVAVVGCGLGLLIPSANFAAAQANPGRSAAAVMWINLCWSIGAVVAPLAIKQLGSAFLWTLTAATIAMAAIGTGATAAPAAVNRDAAPRAIATLTIVAATLMFLYSGTENALGGWLSTYAKRMPETGDLWAVLPSIFWSGLLLGRVAAPSVLRRVSATRLLMLGMSGALVGAALLVAGQGPVTITLATAVAGLSMSAIFPLVVSQYADRAGAGAQSGLLFAASGLGGAAIPSMVGIIADASGSLRTGISILLATLAAMFVLELRLSR